MRIINTLKEINRYIRDKNISGNIIFRGEVSNLIRAANDHISLNTSEQGSKFFIELQKDKKISRGLLAASANDIDKIKQAVDKIAANLEITPDIPFLTPMDAIAAYPPCSAYYDADLAEIDPRTVRDLFRSCFDKFSKRDTALSGAFSWGMYEFAVINTLADEPLYYKGSDFNIELVLQLAKDKKEIKACRVGGSIKDYKPEILINELDRDLHIKENTDRIDIKPGKYDVVFGNAAAGDLLSLLSWLGCSGEVYEYEMGMLPKDKYKINDRIFQDNFTLIDDPDDKDALFPHPFGLNGESRKKFTLFENGILKNLIYSNKIDCDRFGKKINNDQSTVNLTLKAGAGPSDFEAMIKSCITRTIFISNIHYMNSPDRSKGAFTGTSRFGTFLIENGRVVNHLYNLRINDTLFNIFNNIEWLSDSYINTNLSDSYGLRMASSVRAPAFMKIKGVNITGTSNI